MTCRSGEPGWIKIGLTCPAGRRSLWWRVTETGSDEKPEFIELCSGREGDDAYVKIGLDNPRFHELLEVLSTAETDERLRPSDVEILGTIPFADTFRRAECEAAVAWIVMACEHHGNEFKALTFKQVAEALNAVRDREPWKTWNRNPFFHPDFDELVKYGFAEFSPSRETLRLTTEALARLEKWRKPRAG